MPPSIESRGLVKRFGKTTALDGLDLRVEPGQIVAVLGPNGAGKTTFVRAIATLVRPDAGELRVFGHDVRRDPKAVRREIGLAGQFAAVEGGMTGRENIEMVARLYGLSRAEARDSASRVLDRFGLSAAADKLVRTYSGGMRRKLDLGASMAGAPRLLLLDEPTTGVDPRSRLEVWDLVDELAAGGTDVLLTTQYLEEADRLAGHIVIIDNGRAVASGPPAELKSRVGGNVLEVTLSDGADIAAVAGVLARDSGSAPHIDEGARRVTVAMGDESTADRFALGLRTVEQTGVNLLSVTVRQATLNEVFLALTGRDRPGGGEPDGSGSAREATSVPPRGDRS